VILTDLTIVRFNFHVGKAATKKQKYEKISEKKMSTPVEVLCKVGFRYNFCNETVDINVNYFFVFV
jgi:hypothetical protein